MRLCANLCTSSCDHCCSETTSAAMFDWLMGQCSIFVRNRELFSQQPFGITIDEPFVDELADLISRLAMGGLLHATAQLDRAHEPAMRGRRGA